MLNNNHKNASCQFAEQIVAYLYDEADAPEKLKFEMHVKNCSSCADELADFSFVRASVLEWREKEFSNLEQPIFTIPIGQTPTVETRNELKSWFAQIKTLFVFRPVWAAAAFGALIVSVSLTFFALNFSKVNDVAEIDRNEAKKTVASPTAEQIVTPTTDKSSENTLKGENKTATPEINRQPQTSPVKTAVKVTNRIDVKSSPDRENKETTIRDKKPAPKRPVPNLNELDEDEDKTIRLADLFEEIGTE